MNAEISFSTEKLDDDKKVAIFSFFGELDEMTGDDIFQKINAFFEKTDEKYFIFHLKNLEYLNSKSIGQMIDLYRKIIGRGGKLVLAEISENVLDILDLVGVTRVVETAENLEAAKVALLESE